MRLEKNGTYCSEWNKLCWGRQLQEKTEVVSSFGLWTVPGRKAEVVPGICIDLALLVGSLPASWPRGGCSCLGAPLGSRVTKLFLCRREDLSLSLSRGEQCWSEGEGVCTASPSLHGPSKQRRDPYAQP